MDAGTLAEPGDARPVKDYPFCIAVLGDFSGSGGRGDEVEGEPDWKPIRVTPDNMPALAGVAPRLHLRLADGPEKPFCLDFARLDDFHPDALFRRLPLFAELREARAAVKEGRESGFEFAAEADEPHAEVSDRPSDGTKSAPASEPGPASGPPPDRAPPSNGGALLDAIVEETAPSTPSAPALDDELQEFVRNAVRPHLVRQAPDRSAELAAIDRAAGALMRSVLHHRDFKGLESLWRSLVFLLSRIDTTGKVRVYIVDVSRAALERDLCETQDPTRSRLHALLTSPDHTPAVSQWALSVGAYTFGTDPDEVLLLERLGEVARAANVPWFSAGDFRLAGCPSFATTPDPRDWSDAWAAEWAAVPQTPAAPWLGLALPRFLVREPYGADPGPRCKAFDFDEEPESRAEPEQGEPGRERALLWGNPAFLCAALLAQAFARSGWGFATDEMLDVGQAPIARSASADDPRPVLTEHRLQPAAAQQVARVGLMPLMEFPFEARIRLGGVRPVAPPPARLRAWWNL